MAVPGCRATGSSRSCTQESLRSHIPQGHGPVRLLLTPLHPTCSTTGTQTMAAPKRGKGLSGCSCELFTGTEPETLDRNQRVPVLASSTLLKPAAQEKCPQPVAAGCCQDGTKHSWGGSWGYQGRGGREGVWGQPWLPQKHGRKGWGGKGGTAWGCAGTSTRNCPRASPAVGHTKGPICPALSPGPNSS